MLINSLAALKMDRKQTRFEIEKSVNMKATDMKSVVSEIATL